MPVFQRRTLRTHLSQRRLREGVFGATTFSPALANGSLLTLLDRTLAQPDLTNEQLYQRAYVRVESSANFASFSDYRVGTFNLGSGAFLSAGQVRDVVGSGAPFEVHEKISPAELDAAIDETILELRVRREVAIPSVDGALYYTLDGAASPNTIENYLDTYYFANPASSLDRDRRNFTAQAITATATGMELRIGAALNGSMQIAIDALLQLSLPAGDAATINLPDEEVVLWGAAARAYDVLIQRAPGQEATLYQQRRKDAALMFTRLSGRTMPDVSKPLGFAQPFEQRDAWGGG